MASEKRIGPLTGLTTLTPERFVVGRNHSIQHCAGKGHS